MLLSFPRTSTGLKHWKRIYWSDEVLCKTAALSPALCETLLTRLNEAMVTITEVVMVTSGRRTKGLLTTASDTADNHWQDSSFSGNNFWGEEKKKKKRVCKYLTYVYTGTEMYEYITYNLHRRWMEG